MTYLILHIIEEIFGEIRRHNEMSGQLSVDCPACSADKGMPQGDGRGNLEVNYEQGVFKCWSCKDTNNMQGPVVKLLKKYASKKNLKDYMLLRPDDFKKIEKEKVKIDVVLPESYKELSKCTFKDYRYNDAMLYLRNRGITNDIIKEFKIGYTTSGHFYNRIIIPSYDSEGKLNYFIARWYDKKYSKLKYLNPDAEKQEIVFNEGKVNWDATIYLVEGATDHIVVPNSIPLLGKYISEKLFDLLLENAMGFIVIVLDGDAFDDALFLYKQLNFGAMRGRIKICKPQGDMDPSKVHEKYGKAGVIQMLRTARALKEHEMY